MRQNHGFKLDWKILHTDISYINDIIRHIIVPASRQKFSRLKRKLGQRDMTTIRCSISNDDIRNSSLNGSELSEEYIKKLEERSILAKHFGYGC